MVQLEFELAYDDVAFWHVSHYATWTPPVRSFPIGIEVKPNMQHQWQRILIEHLCVVDIFTTFLWIHLCVHNVQWKTSIFILCHESSSLSSNRIAARITLILSLSLSLSISLSLFIHSHWSSLFIVPVNGILCLNRTDECKFLLVKQHWNVHVSVEELRLRFLPCFASCVQHVLIAFLGCFVWG